MRFLLTLFVVALPVLGWMFGCSPEADHPRVQASARHPAANGYHAYDPEAKGEQLIADATAKARAENKRVLVVFGGNWCKWCHALDGLFQSDAAVKQVLDKSFVVVHVDSDNNGALNEKYKNPFANGFPVMLVLDGDGQLLHTQDTGIFEKEDKSLAHDPDKVVAFLKSWTQT